MVFRMRRVQTKSPPAKSGSTAPEGQQISRCTSSAEQRSRPNKASRPRRNSSLRARRLTSCRWRETEPAGAEAASRPTRRAAQDHRAARHRRAAEADPAREARARSERDGASRGQPRHPAEQSKRKPSAAATKPAPPSIAKNQPSRQVMHPGGLLKLTYDQVLQA